MTSPSFIYDPPETRTLPIIYQDDAVLVVNKPSGLLSVPGRLEHHKDSLFLRLLAIYPDVLTVHRLDMSTSGLMVFARGPVSHRALSRQFENRRVEKSYLADVWGVPKAEQGEVTLPLVRDWPNRPRQKVCHDTGKPSHTHWRVISRGDHTARLELTPLTGRTHQLRVHLAAIGHPILGDEFYGNGQSETMAERLCLHAAGLTFNHPVSSERMSFQSEASFD